MKHISRTAVELWGMYIAGSKKRESRFNCQEQKVIGCIGFMKGSNYSSHYIHRKLLPLL